MVSSVRLTATAAALAALTAVLLYYVYGTLGPDFEAGPAGRLPHVPPPREAVAVYANPDLSFVNEVIEYLFPALLDLGSMVRCPILRPDGACMERGRRDVGAGMYAAILKTHEESTLRVERGGGADAPPLEIVLLVPRNRTAARPPPLVFWMHGGGFVLGRARDVHMAGLMQKMTAHSAGKGWGPAFSDAVWASVEYRLAPEHPYPAAPDDCVLALEHLLAKHTLPDGTRLGSGGVHVAGASAGGVLAANAALRALRASMRVDSVYADVPAFPTRPRRDDGAGILSVFDSDSYRRNWYTRIPGVAWAEWFWGAYTGCPQAPPESGAEPRPEACRREAEYFAGGALSPEEWGAAKGHNGGRLPPLLVMSCKGDLFGDGARPLLEAYGEADAQAVVRHVEASASHALGYDMDPKAAAEVFDTWGTMIHEATQQVKGSVEML